MVFYLSAEYNKHGANKKCEYAQRIWEIEHGVFTPLILSASGGMALEATIYKWLAKKLSAKREEHYSVVMG